MTIYLDTSALVPIHVEEPSSLAIGDILGALDALPIISDFAVGEFGSVISRYVRMALLSERQAHTLLDDFDDWLATSAELMAISTRDLQRASRIVRQFDLKLRFPDAVHIAICANRTLTLASRDKQMIGASAAIGVSVLRLD